MASDDHPLKRPLTHVGGGVVIGAIAGVAVQLSNLPVGPLGIWGPVAVMATVAVPATAVLFRVDPHPDRYERPLRVGIAACVGGTAVSLVAIYSFLFGGPLPLVVLERPELGVAVGCLLGASVYLAWLLTRR